LKTKNIKLEVQPLMKFLPQIFRVKSELYD